MIPNNLSQKPKPMVWWILWAAFLAGIPQFYFFLAPKHAVPASGESPMVFFAAVPLFISTAIRWLVLPRVRIAQVAMALFILGIAFSESVCFLGLFIFSGSTVALVSLSFLGILQFAPFFAGKYEA